MAMKNSKYILIHFFAYGCERIEEDGRYANLKAAQRSMRERIEAAKEQHDCLKGKTFDATDVQIREDGATMIDQDNTRYEWQIIAL